MASRKRPRKSTDPNSTTRPSTVRSGRPGVDARLAWLAPWVAVLGLLAILYPGPMLEGHVYGSADASASDAFRQVGDAARADGDYPFWNPYLFLGMPSFGSLAYTHGVYPPTLVFELLQDDLGSPPLTWLLGHLLLGGVGLWWMLGRWNTPWAARLLGCVVWLWFARVVAWGVHGHGSKLGAAMAMPWLVGLTWEVLVRGRVRAAGLAAIVLGLQFLRGHVQISYYTLLAMGLLTAWHLAWPLGEGPRPSLAQRGRRAGLMAAVVALGFAMGSALLLPVQSYADISTRGQDGASGGGRTPYEYATDWSMAPEDLAAAVVPAAAGFGKATYVGRMPFTDYPNYFGLLVLPLAAAAWLTRRRSLVAALGAVTLMMLLLAMGRFSPGVYQLAHAALPYFDKFRVPSMAMVVPALALAVLAALGATALAGSWLQRGGPWPRRAACVVIGVGALLLLGGITGAVAGAYRGHLADLAARAGKSSAPVLLDAAWSLHRDLLVRQGLVLLAAGGALLLAMARPRFREAGLLPVLALLVAVDLGSVARLVTHPEAGLVEVARTADGGRLVPATRLERSWPGPAGTQIPRTLAGPLQRIVGHDRLLPLGADANNNGFMTIGVRSLGGYHPAKPAAAEAVRQRLFAGVPSGPVARWLGAAAVLYPGALDAESLALLAEAGLPLEPEGVPAAGRMIYPVRDPSPRARLVDRWRLAEDPRGPEGLDRFLDGLEAGRRDPATRAVLDREPDPVPVAGTTPLPRPEYLRDGTDVVELRVDTPRPAVLVLADAMAPGWRAWIDGEPATLLTADHILRAVAVPAGEHVVRFSYHDPAFARGRNLALAGLVGASMLVAWPWLRRRRAATNTQGD